MPWLLRSTAFDADMQKSVTIISRNTIDLSALRQADDPAETPRKPFIDVDVFANTVALFFLRDISISRPCNCQYSGLGSEFNLRGIKAWSKDINIDRFSRFRHIHRRKSTVFHATNTGLAFENALHVTMQPRHFRKYILWKHRPKHNPPSFHFKNFDSDNMMLIAKIL